MVRKKACVLIKVFFGTATNQTVPEKVRNIILRSDAWHKYTTGVKLPKESTTLHDKMHKGAWRELNEQDKDLMENIRTPSWQRMKCKHMMSFTAHRIS